MASSFASRGILLRRLAHGLINQAALPGISKGSSQNGLSVACRAALVAETPPSKRRLFSSSSASSRVLVTFDIDGTLVEAIGTEANKMHKGAFSHALKELYGVDGTIDAVKHHGSTDKSVIKKTALHYGVSEEKIMSRWDDIAPKMLEYARGHVAHAAEGLHLLPGVLHLLKTLAARDDVVTGLVTGNLSEIAWMKMNALGIKDLFSPPYIGGFGSDHVDRGELVKIAAARAAQSIPGPSFGVRVHVGDTPNDVSAALYGGAHAVGVLTGAFEESELLEAAKGDRNNVTILENLEDSERFLSVCGLSNRS
ncbi:haloacid dehalogenase-like hydrolase (HAD) superfamily protein [Klebsormidium nitens]|uniref:Haloacid dehalogenase-like hydrolase (HAD) superfamily protein n=1 Tax=Klebsormidium nitens TaxID=105231 RepID=A0A1Y1IBF1_KLENI|nr:haloacid dehalogenase-like hydrolase (HAD) superfamily protein [Klebsormidium nitens]|eukprot:GAQ88295.1 haloacid dehalogenase-like hydrolase (HAD) superfamily protein [Klebsormidium nitens]